MNSALRWVAIAAALLGLLLVWDIFFLEQGLIVQPWRAAVGELSLWWRLRSVGVRRLEGENLSALVRDHCAAPGPGQKPTHCGCVALVHGLGDQALSWRKQLEAPYDAPLRFYAWDLPGSGKSARLSPLEVKDGGYRVRRLARLLKLEMERPVPKDMQPCASWTVVGNSLGGWIAAWLAIDWPERVGQLVLSDSAGLSTARPALKKKHLDGTVAALQDFQARAYAKPRKLTAQEWSYAAARLRKSPVAEIRAAQVPEDDLDGHLKRITQRTLILWGESDRVTPVSDAHRLRAGIRGASQLALLPACGHLPQRECPEQWKSAFLRWWHAPELIWPASTASRPVSRSLSPAGLK